MGVGEQEREQKSGGAGQEPTGNSDARANIERATYTDGQKEEGDGGMEGRKRGRSEQEQRKSNHR